MSSVVRFDLLNCTLREPVIVDPCKVGSFPTVKRLLLAPRSGNGGGGQTRRTAAFVEMDGTVEDSHEKAEEFMAWVCWLLSLGELHDVYYWGSHHFVQDKPSWAWHASSWRILRTNEWSPNGPWAAGGGTAFEGAVLPWRLPDFLSLGFTRFSDPTFQRDEFIVALQLFLDSRPYNQLGEFRYIKKWTPFEAMINRQAEADNSIYVFGKDKAPDFSELRKSLSALITEHPAVKGKPDAELALQRQLSALERVPIKILTPMVLVKLGITYQQTDVDELVNMRNKILHYAETAKTTRAVWELSDILDGFLVRMLFTQFGWDFEKELKANYKPAYTAPLPNYVKSVEPTIAPKTGAGILVAEDGTRIECEGTITWSREKIEGEFVGKDEWGLKLDKLSKDWKWVTVTLQTNGRVVSAERGKIPHVEMPSARFRVVALKLTERVKG